MKNKSLITCIIPTYNRASLLSDAIESVIKQTYNNWELIIIDDGCTDNTPDIVRNYRDKDKRIRYFKNPNKGGNSARNYGIKKAKGNYIAFLDDDDISLPKRFETQLYTIDHTSAEFIVSGYEVRDRKSNKLINSYVNELKAKGAGFPSRWLVSRDLLMNVGGFDESMPAMQEVELSYRLAEVTTFTLHSEIVSIIFPTSNSISLNKENAIAGKLRLLEKHETKMPKLEAASWYFSIANSYLSIGEYEKSVPFFAKVLLLDDQNFYTNAVKFIKSLRFIAASVKLVFELLANNFS